MRTYTKYDDGAQPAVHDERVLRDAPPAPPAGGAAAVVVWAYNAPGRCWEGWWYYWSVLLSALSNKQEECCAGGLWLSIPPVPSKNFSIVFFFI